MKFLWRIIPHKHIYRLGDFSGRRCRRCERFRKLEQEEKKGTKQDNAWGVESEFSNEEPKKQVVYVVRQTQTCENFYDTAIYVCSTEKEATRRARLLNQTYGSNCKFSDEWDYEDIEEGAEDYHYYDVEAFPLDERFCG